MKKLVILVLLILSDFAFAKKIPTFGPYLVKINFRIAKNTPKPQFQKLTVKAENVTTGVTYQSTKAELFRLRLPPGFYKFSLLNGNCGANNNLVEVMESARVVLEADCSDDREITSPSSPHYYPALVID